MYDTTKKLKIILLVWRNCDFGCVCLFLWWYILFGSRSGSFPKSCWSGSRVSYDSTSIRPANIYLNFLHTINKNIVWRPIQLIIPLCEEICATKIRINWTQDIEILTASTFVSIGVYVHVCVLPAKSIFIYIFFNSVECSAVKVYTSDKLEGSDGYFATNIGHILVHIDLVATKYNMGWYCAWITARCRPCWLQRFVVATADVYDIAYLKILCWKVSIWTQITKYNNSIVAPTKSHGKRFRYT